MNGATLNKKAFSLVELMVVIGLTIVVATIISALFLNTQRFFMHSDARNKARKDASYVIRVFERELRQMTQSSESLESIEQADKNQLIFFADTDNDDKPERITYALSGNSIIKKVYQTTNDAPPWRFSMTGVSHTITRNTANSSSKALFSYYSAIDNELSSVPLSKAQRADVKIIKVSVEVIFPKGIKGDQLETEIYLRNTNDPL